MRCSRRSRTYRRLSVCKLQVAILAWYFFLLTQEKRSTKSRQNKEIRIITVIEQGQPPVVCV